MKHASQSHWSTRGVDADQKRFARGSTRSINAYSLLSRLGASVNLTRLFGHRDELAKHRKLDSHHSEAELDVPSVISYVAPIGLRKLAGESSLG
jgi:hypothetical protein